MTGHGNVNEICAWLLRDYGPDMRLTALIWTAQDVHHCTEGMGTTDDEAEIVLADIAAHREHHDTGIDRQAVREMVRNWRAEAHRTRMVSLPADSLEALLNSAGRWLVSGGEDADGIRQAVGLAQEALGK
ncbi:DUF1380 family protein [Pantoea sp. At-9b]|uniref:DUF1380 family protein n=1 Tax=Pantoea sp. (strain At-9b) TaxID=592316 RepID=UPI0001B3F580|nr:DUF1380 family protein [Pantoea sp. At-9b]ADU73032.1 hypothetical protein Pat9b_4051 [Pantoea sp. At-9b]